MDRSLPIDDRHQADLLTRSCRRCRAGDFAPSHYCNLIHSKSLLRRNLAARFTNTSSLLNKVWRNSDFGLKADRNRPIPVLSIYPITQFDRPSTAARRATNHGSRGLFMGMGTGVRAIFAFAAILAITSIVRGQDRKPIVYNISHQAGR